MPKTEEQILRELAKFLPLYMIWADCWHGQSGGYTASDTANIIMRMEVLRDEICNRYGQQLGRGAHHSGAE